MVSLGQTTSHEGGGGLTLVSTASIFGKVLGRRERKAFWPTASSSLPCIHPAGDRSGKAVGGRDQSRDKVKRGGKGGAWPREWKRVRPARRRGRHVSFPVK